MQRRMRLNNQHTKLTNFLDKLGIKSAKEYGWVDYPYVQVGSGAVVKLNGVKINYLSGVDYDLKDIGIFPVLRDDN